ncbi:MAG: outer membrane protein transport protein [Polyangiaceae bacterium]
MKRALCLIATLAVMGPSATAAAAGLYFSERGVRPFGRGGAFVAGADDLGAIWYNPAGIYDAGTSILFDASWLNFTSDYTRRALLQQTDPNTGQPVGQFEQTFPTVSGSSPIIPIPTLAGSIQVAPDWVIAFGAMAPYSAITSYPELVGNQPAPSRYSLITLEGSALAIVGGWVAYKPIEELRFGIGLELLVGRFAATTMFTACIPDRFFCAPEQPEWDSLTQLDVGPIVAPTGNIGVQYLPLPWLRAGLSFQAPTVIRAPGKIRVRLPSTPAFERASISGEDASVAFELPPALRWGVQVEPIDRLFVELDGSWEAWSIHDAIVVDPEGVAIQNLPGFPNPTYVPAQNLPRNFKDSLAVRLGGEYFLDTGDVDVIFRGGVSYESTAIPSEYLTVLTVDTNKITTSLGLGVGVSNWRFDATFGHIFGLDVDVDPATARVPAMLPIQANAGDSPHTVNGGTYSARANVVGIGLVYTFDDDEQEAAPPEAGAEEAQKDEEGEDDE